MKNAWMLIVITALFSGAGLAADKVNAGARALIARKKITSVPRIKDAPLLTYSLSPSPALQNRSETVFVQSNNGFPARITTLDVKVNGQSFTKTLNPTRNFWAIPLGVLKEIRRHEIEASLYLESAQDNADIRDMIRLLDRDINRLTNQINGERDATQRKILQAQREEKAALKNELVAQLRKLRVKVGSQPFSFEVAANSADPSVPGITEVAPAVGKISGGTSITITGTNFSSPAQIFLGGIAATGVSVEGNHTIRATTPVFPAGGSKDVEVRSGGFNAILKNAFYATDAGLAPKAKPVAVATGNQKINLGSPAVLDGTMSYDPNPEDQIAYSWSFVSTPAGSQFQNGQTFSQQASATFNPDVSGTFVMQLVVRETNTAELQESDPSIVVVQAIGQIQASANPITVERGRSQSTNITVTHSEPGRLAQFRIVSGPNHNSATVSSIGEVTYVASEVWTGNDSVSVRVSDDTGLFTDVIIPVTVTATNHAPVPTAQAINVPFGGTATSQVGSGDSDPADTHAYTITAVPLHGTAAINGNGLVSFTAHTNYYGSDALTVRVTDQGGLSGSVTIPITITNQAPVLGTAGYHIKSSGFPVQVRHFLSSASDPDGSIRAFEWTFSDGTRAVAPGAVPAGQVPGIVHHDYMAAGTYTATVRAVDNLGMYSDPRTINVVVVDTDLPTPVFTLDQNTGAAPLPVIFTQSSTDSNGIAQYRWLWGDGSAELVDTTGGIVSKTFQNPGAYRVRLRLRDAYLAETEAFVSVYAGVTPPAAGSPPFANLDASPRQFFQGATVSFSGTRSGDAVPGNSLVDWSWNFGDSSEPNNTASGQSVTHQFNGASAFNKFVELRVTNNLGAVSPAQFLEVFQVNQGHAPRAQAREHYNRTIAASTTLTFDGSWSFDYDGTIQSHEWIFGDGSPNSTEPSPTKTFSVPGTYFVGHRVTDNHNNLHYAWALFTVVPSALELPKMSVASPSSEDEKHVLTGACGQGSGEACALLADIYAAEGDAFTAQNLKQRACSFGYTPACSVSAEEAR